MYLLGALVIAYPDSGQQIIVRPLIDRVLLAYSCSSSDCSRWQNAAVSHLLDDRPLFRAVLRRPDHHDHLAVHDRAQPVGDHQRLQHNHTNPGIQLVRGGLQLRSIWRILLQL